MQPHEDSRTRTTGMRTMPTLRENTGEYDIEQLKVTVHDERSASLHCYRLMINSPHYTWHVKLGWRERRKGITLEQKIQQRKAEIIQWCQVENEKIRQQRALEEKLNAR